jgi:hypothetical protein
MFRIEISLNSKKRKYFLTFGSSFLVTADMFPLISVFESTILVSDDLSKKFFTSELLLFNLLVDTNFPFDSSFGVCFNY